LIRVRKPDILLSSLYYPNIITVLARLLAGSPTRVVVTEHNHHKRLLRYKRFRRIVWRLMSFTYRRASKIVTVSADIKDALVSDFRIDPEQLRAIYNPLESDAIRELSAEEVAHPFFEPGEERFVVIGVGRLTRQKNFGLLIRALARAREEIPACLLILGQGEMERSLRDLADRLGVSEVVDFVGFQHNPYKWMQRSDLFVLASSWEGFGIVIAEAQLCGIPAISADCPAGPSEIITDGRSGLLVPSENVDALAAAIVRIARDDRLRERLVEGGLASAARFDHSVIVPQYEKLFEELLA
jgi:glycosyltransferase involved in cell wall biosynthesis